jgi:signal transduction histidine kinase
MAMASRNLQWEAEQINLRLNLQRTDLRDVVSGSVASFKPIADAKHVALQYEALTSSGECSADPKRVFQIICNLLSNAVKLTPSGGRVLVRLSDEASG